MKQLVLCVFSADATLFDPPIITDYTKAEPVVSPTGYSKQTPSLARGLEPQPWSYDNTPRDLV